jgi:hypothetical protein
MIFRSIACLLVALGGVTPGSPRAADAACSAAGELCMPGVSGTEHRIVTPPRGRIEVVRLRSSSDVRNASIRPLAFDEIQLLHQMFGALVVNETVHVDRGYMFSLDRKNSSADNWRLQNVSAAGLVTEAVYWDGRTGSRFGAAPLYENRDRQDDIWVAPDDARLLLSRVIPARLTDWDSSGELQDLLMRYVETRLETGQRSRYWSHSLPEWHIAWSLALGLLVVALRRMPLRFRSNGL